MPPSRRPPRSPDNGDKRPQDLELLVINGVKTCSLLSTRYHPFPTMGVGRMEEEAGDGFQKVAVLHQHHV